MEAMTRGEIIKAVWQNNKGHLKKYQVQNIVDEALNEIKNGLIAGRHIKIKGFGSFRAVTMPEGKRHNPKTMELVEVPEHKKVRFKTGRLFKKQLTHGKPLVTR